MRKLLVRLILGRRNKYFDVVEMKGKPYKVDICPYESSEDLIKRAASNGVLTAHKFTE